MIPEGWQKVHVSDLIATLDAGVSVNGTDRQKCDGEVGVLKVSAVSYGVFNPKANKAVISEDICRVKESPLQGHIIVSRSNSPELVAASVLVDKDYPDLFLSDKLWQLKQKGGKQFCVEWLAYYLDSPPVRYKLSKLATGTSDSMKNISKADLFTLKVNLPSFTEQKEIAKILGCYSSSIDLTERLIAAKQERRTWLMQQLLTGKRRLPGGSNAWSTMTIGEITEEVSKRNQGQLGADAVRAVNKAEGMIPMKNHVMADDLSRYKVVEKTWFSYNPMRINIGSICQLMEAERALVSPEYVVFRCKEHRIDHRYFNAFRRSHRWQSFMDAAGNGSVRIRIYFEDLARLTIFLPPLEEQRRIADFIDVANRELDLLRNQLDALREQKKGLMQQLLTGKIRVKV